MCAGTLKLNKNKLFQTIKGRIDTIMKMEKLQNWEKLE